MGKGDLAPTKSFLGKILSCSIKYGKARVRTRRKNLTFDLTAYRGHGPTYPKKGDAVKVIFVTDCRPYRFLGVWYV